MNPHLRPALPCLAVGVLNLGIIHSWGFYSRWAFLAVIISLILGVAACRWSEIPATTGQRWRPLALLALVLGFVAPFTAGLWYVDNEPAERAVPVFLFASAVIAGVLTFHARRLQLQPAQRSQLLFFACVFLALGVIVRNAVLNASPDPVVDVYCLLRDGADHLIAGKNPYANDIVSPYGTAQALRFQVLEPPDPRPAGYPPLPLLFSIPPRIVGMDVRWSNVAAELIAAIALVVLGQRRARLPFGVLAAATYLSLPRSPFLIEQAWYEPMLAALFGVGFVLAEFDDWRRPLGYVALGFGLTAKQFGLPLLAPLAIARRRHWKWILVGLVAGGLVMLPFFLWSPRDFLDIVISKHLARPPQFHSITVGSFLVNEFGVTMPRVMGWILAALAMIAIGLITPRDSAATALGLGTALLAFCVFHTQGFPNYFYLVQYLWLLGFVGLLPRPSEENADVAPRPAA